MATWLEDVIQALVNLGGQAALKDIQAEVKSIRTDPLPKAWKMIINHRLNQHTASSTRFQGPEYFTKLDRGYWALSSDIGSTKIAPKTKSLKKKNAFSYQTYDSVETIKNLLKTIKEYREFSVPESSSWKNYIEDFFHILGFRTKFINQRFMFLSDQGKAKTPLAIVGIIFPEENFEGIISGIDWETYIFYICQFYQVDWGILTDGYSLKILNYRGKKSRQTFYSSKLDETIINNNFESFYEIYKEVAKIKGEIVFASKGKSTRKRKKPKAYIQDQFDLNHHLNRSSPSTIANFNALRSQILSLSRQVAEKYNKLYISYSVDKNFCEIHFQRNQLKIWVNLSIEAIQGSKSLCRDVRGIGHYGNAETEIILRNQEDIDVVFGVIKQSFHANR